MTNRRLGRFGTAVLTLGLLPWGSSAVDVDAEELRQRYLIGLDSPIAHAENLVPRGRTVARLRHVNAFAVELTAVELEALRRSVGISYVEPDVERHALGAMPPSNGVRPENSTQALPYGLLMTRADRVWDVTRGRGIRVAVIDTGIDLEHPDLIGRYRGGLDMVNGGAIPQDDNGHGTHVSGIIAATDNEFGIVGVAPEVEIYALKVLNHTGSGSAFNVIRALEWAIDNDIDVVNLSLGGSSASVTEAAMFEKVAEAGIVSVAASGNDYPDEELVHYPAAYDHVIAIGAVDETRMIAEFTQRGPALDLVAAGVGVESTIIEPNSYRIDGEGFGAVYGTPMRYSPEPETAGGVLVLAGVGSSSDFGPDVAGNVALIERGSDLNFNQKSSNASNAGASVAIIYNDQPGSFRGTLCSDQSNCTPPNVPANPILTVSVSREDAHGFLLPAVGTSITMVRGKHSGYGRLNGTSMATPHVTGIVALLKSLVPTATPDEIYAALTQSAHDLGAVGRDDVYGYGLADARSAGEYLRPEAFIVSETRRRSVGRPTTGD